MSRLTCAAGLALAITIVAPAARGEGDVNAAPAPAARGEGPVEAAPPPRLRWSLGTRIGYAYAWNTGQSHLDLGTGLAGLDLRALFVPARVASPIGGIYGVFGFER